MLFTAPSFFGFFVVVFCLYYLPVLRGHQLPLLLVASFFFYAYSQPYLLLLLVISAAVSAAGDAVMVGKRREGKLAWAVAGVGLNIATLGFFKYGGLIERSFFARFGPDDGTLGALLSLPLPIGISFYSFTASA